MLEAIGRGRSSGTEVKADGIGGESMVVLAIPVFADLEIWTVLARWRDLWAARFPTLLVSINDSTPRTQQQGPGALRTARATSQLKLGSRA